MINYYTTPNSKHSALLVIDVQRDFTLMGAIAETPGTLKAVQYIKHLVLQRPWISYNSCYKTLSCRWV